MSTVGGRAEAFRVLVVDDEADIRLGLRLLLARRGFDVREAPDAETALVTLEAWSADVLITDVEMGSLSGLELLRRARARHPDLQVILITGFGSIERAVEAMRLGASHFLCKPLDQQEILAEIDRCGRRARVNAEVRALGATDRPRRLVVEDPKMREVAALISDVAPTAMPVLIYGESGTGKELVARAIHDQGRDPDAPFLAVNSAALPDTLLESELFGHVRGAFTNAARDREGVFRKAHGGTIFLDEIASMSLAFQSKLLRVLQERTVTPLGSSTAIPVSFRLIAATNQSLRRKIAEGTFREDLYYRLRVVSIHVPPLRERAEDLEPLARHFIERYAGVGGLGYERRPVLTVGALETLRRHRWPGNIRELENCIQRALVVCHGHDIEAADLALEDESAEWRREPVEELSYEAGKDRVIKAFQRRTVERALRLAGGNVTQAALTCGLTRAALQRIMRSLGLERETFRAG